MTPCGLITRYQCTLIIEAAACSETLVPIHQTLKRHFPEDGHFDWVLKCSSSEGFGEQPLIFLPESKD
jgi:hypothetical protein